MGKIVAIGGGEIGRPGYPVETTQIDKRILELTGKSKPSVLFLPTASGDSPLYCQVFNEHFGGRLGCNTDVLYLIRKKPSSLQEMIDKILRADAVYVGGGNTARMMQVWRACGIDQALLEAYCRGIVMSGLSVGAICWFRYGSSDSRKFSDPEAGLMRVRGLGFVNATLCPHFDVEEDRMSELKEMMKRTPGVAVALDNCCAIEIVDGMYRILNSKTSVSAYRVFWLAGTFVEEIITEDADYASVDKLLCKRNRNSTA